jgi:hypothetical protein
MAEFPVSETIKNDYPFMITSSGGDYHRGVSAIQFRRPSNIPCVWASNVTIVHPMINYWPFTTEN